VLLLEWFFPRYSPEELAFPGLTALATSPPRLFGLVSLPLFFGILEIYEHVYLNKLS
jgi:hypothetical protein